MRAALRAWGLGFEGKGLESTLPQTDMELEKGRYMDGCPSDIQASMLV